MDILRQRFNEVRIALMLLTRLPAGRVGEPVPTLADARWAYPLIGAFVAIIVWSIFTGAMALGFSAFLAAPIALAASALLTGALHHDGLADFCDGIGGGRDRQHRLDIMRDSRIGSYGVVGLVLVLILMTGAWAQLGARATLLCFIAMAVGSRFAMLALLTWLPAARDDGLGQRAVGHTRWPLLVGGGLFLIAMAPLGVKALIVLPVMGLVVAAIGGLALRKLGGQTGDVLGAVQMFSECAGWMALVAAMTR